MTILGTLKNTLEKGATLKKKEQHSRKRNKTQEKRYKTHKAPGSGGGEFPPCPPLEAAPESTFSDNVLHDAKICVNVKTHPKPKYVHEVLSIFV